MTDIVITDLSKAYGEKAVLQHLSLTLPAGQITALLAPSGWGKTTLLRLLMGLDLPDQGRITGCPQDLAAVFQEDRLCMDFNPVANIRLPSPALSREDVLEAMEAVGLTGCATQPARELSGGMQRRVSLLRALLSPASCLLLDEPFKGLDEELHRQVLAYTRSQCAGRTVLLVTHREEEARAIGAAQLLQYN